MDTSLALFALQNSPMIHRSSVALKGKRKQQFYRVAKCHVIQTAVKVRMNRYKLKVGTHVELYRVVVVFDVFPQSRNRTDAKKSTDYFNSGCSVNISALTR